MQGARGKKDKRYGAYLLFSLTLFLLYIFVFDGKSAFMGTVLLEGNNEATPASAVVLGGRGLTGTAPAADFPGFPVDLNTATAEELTVLPGIGPATARRIVKAREESGGFSSVDDLLDVKWIGRVKLETLRSLVTVGPATALN